MIEEYQNLLNECIDLREDKETLADMRITLWILKNEIEKVKSGLYVIGGENDD